MIGNRHLPAFLGWSALFLGTVWFAVSGDQFVVYIGTMILIWALWGTSFNVIWGYAGAFSFAQVGLAAIGAYSVAILGTNYGVNFWVAALAGVVLSVLASLVIGFISFRLKHFAFGIMTLAFGLLILRLIRSWDEAGTTTGLGVVTDIGTIGPWDLGSQDGGLLWTTFVVLVVSLALLTLVERRRLGRAVMSMREDDVLAASIGLSPLYYRLIAFAASAAIAAVAGIFYALSFGFITPDMFGFEPSIALVAIVIFGGIGRLFGPVIGAFVYISITQWLHIGGDYSPAVAGVLLILTVLFAPTGLLGVFDKISGRFRPKVRASGQDRTTPRLETADREVEQSPALPSEGTGPRPGSPVLLSVKGATKRFGGLVAVSDVSFELREGEVLGVIGPNGAGKTTLFNLISGFDSLTSGSVELAGTDISRVSPYARANKGLVRTFQQARSFPRFTVAENLVIAEDARQLHSDDSARTSLKVDTTEVIEELGLEDVLNVPAGKLSYGQAKKLSLAIALTRQPKVLLLDEPAAGLNPAEANALVNDIVRLRGRGMTICLVEHNMGLVMGVSDRVIVLDAGRLIAEGDPREVQADPRVIAAYLGTETV